MRKMESPGENRSGGGGALASTVEFKETHKCESEKKQRALKEQ